MNTGMLWFDNDKKTALSAKIERAVDYYRKKYGREPNLCLVHPSMFPEPAKDAHEPQVMHDYNITVRPYRPVLPGHLWIGMEDKGDTNVQKTNEKNSNQTQETNQMPKDG